MPVQTSENRNTQKHRNKRHKTQHKVNKTTKQTQTRTQTQLTLLVLDLLLDVLDGVARLHVKSDGFAREGLDEDLHAAATAEAEHQVEGRLLLDVIVSERAAV